MGADDKMKYYYHFEEYPDISLCDCIVDKITAFKDKLVFHVPYGLVGVGDASEYSSALDVHIVGCGIDSLLIYEIRIWSIRIWPIFRKRIYTVVCIDYDKLKRMLNSGYKIRITEEYFGYECMYIKGVVVKQNGKCISKEIKLILEDVNRVDFVTSLPHGL